MEKDTPILVGLRHKLSTTSPFLREVCSAIEREGEVATLIVRLDGVIPKMVQGDIRCMVDTSEYFIMYFTDKPLTKESIPQHYTEKPHDQKRARRELASALKNVREDRSEVTKKYKKGPRRIEISYIYKSAVRDQHGIVTELRESSSRSPELMVRNWNGADFLSQSQDLVVINSVYITRLALVPASQESAQAEHVFLTGDQPTITALRTLRVLMLSMKENEFAVAKKWQPQLTGNVSRNYATHAHYSSTPTTLLRTSGDEEGLQLLVRRIERMKEGQRLVGLPFDGPPAASAGTHGKFTRHAGYPGSYGY